MEKEGNSFTRHGLQGDTTFIQKSLRDVKKLIGAWVGAEVNSFSRDLNFTLT